MCTDMPYLNCTHGHTKNRTGLQSTEWMAEPSTPGTHHRHVHRPTHPTHSDSQVVERVHQVLVALLGRCLQGEELVGVGQDHRLRGPLQEAHRSGGVAPVTRPELAAGWVGQEGEGQNQSATYVQDTADGATQHESCPV